MAKVCSGLVGLVLVMAVAAGQQPPPADKAPPKAPGASPAKPAADSLEAMIAAAQRNHPDVRLAQAKLQMAQAELEQAKLQAAQRVAAAHAKVQAARAQMEFETRSVGQYDKLGPALSLSDRLANERVLVQAKAALAAAEAELQAAQGLAAGQHAAAAIDKGPGSVTEAMLQALLDTDTRAEHQKLAALAYLKKSSSPPAPGTAADKLRGLIDKPVKLDLKNPVPLDVAMAAFVKQAGLTDLTVRYPEWAGDRFLKTPPTVGPLVGEQAVAAWFQLILDDFNRSLAAVGVPPGDQGKYEVYVRDYGLLVTKTDLAPPGAPTLAEFARQVQAQKEAAAKPGPKK